MTEQEKQDLAHNNYPFGSDYPIGSSSRSLYEEKKESFLNGFEVAISVTRCCKSDSEQLRSSCSWCNGNKQSKSDRVANITDIG